MSRIALFGGSFDPIHNAHIEIAKRALTGMDFDEIIFIPSGVSPHKDSLVTSGIHRYNMVKAAISEEERFSVSDFEIKKETKCYSFETLEEFKKRYPEDELYFIMGDDQYEKFTTWYKWEELLTMCKFLVFTRGGSKIEPPFAEMKIPPIEISSSDIRERLKYGLCAASFVPESVLSYIKEKGLYREDERITKIKEKLKGALKESRYSHTLGVVETALSLAKHYGVSVDKAVFAAYLHDSAKNLSDDELFASAEKYDIKLSDEDKKVVPILHSYVGKFVAMEEYGIKDEEVLDAIYYHTTGKENMSLLCKIIFIADMTEPGRKDFAGLSEIRALMYEDIDKALLKAFDSTIRYNIEKGALLHLGTLKARNFILAKGKN